ncbi:hypothetical protein D3C85_525220 [compost metagenome]
MRLASMGVALGVGQDSIGVIWGMARSAVSLRRNVAVQETDNTPARSRVQQKHTGYDPNYIYAPS